MIKEIENLPDISFIDDITLDQVQAEMVAAYEEKYQEIEKKSLKLKRSDPETLKLYAAAVQILHLYMKIDNTGKMNLLKYSYGDYLDHLGVNKSVYRLPAYPATVAVRFTLSEVRPSAVTIPKGTRVSNGDDLYFETDYTVEISIGQTSATVSCTCLNVGEEGNGLIAGAINTIVDPIPHVASVSSIEETKGGSDVERDDDLKERIYLAPSGYSVAGPAGAYEFHTRSCSSSIGDVEVSSPKPCEVEVRFLLNDASLPSEGLIEDVQEYLSDKTRRPLTDKVTVLSPDVFEFDVNFIYWLNITDKDKAITIQTEVIKAVDNYITWQTSVIGRDINPSVLIQHIVNAGAKRIEVRSPVFTTVSTGSVPRIGQQTVIYGGLEDD